MFFHRNRSLASNLAGLVRSSTSKYEKSSPSVNACRNYSFLMKTKREQKDVPSLNVLLSNGRFPVAVDLARQLKQAGHTVFVVDPMSVHVCKVSTAVKKSFQVPAPRDNAADYITSVKSVVKAKEIDLIIPLHEEIFHLAECGDPEIQKRLFAPPFAPLVRLHDKWEFNRFLKRLGLDYPRALLCKSMEQIQNLDRTKEWALKPVYGRANGGVFHLRPEKPLPSSEEIAVTAEEPYTAQEWLYGSRYCSYSILRGGKLRAMAIYPVKDTLDGSSCVYFESIEHAGIRAYVEQIVAAHPGVSGQMGFDFVETDSGRLVAIECNPRATSGIHLFGGTPNLAKCITAPAKADSSVGEEEVLVPLEGTSRQFGPAMLLVPERSGSYFKRLVKTKDVTFSIKDVLPLPTLLLQPIFLTCIGLCQGEGGTSIPNLYQEDLLWEPLGEQLERVRGMLKELEESQQWPQIGNGGVDVKLKNAGDLEGDGGVPHGDVLCCGRIMA